MSEDTKPHWAAEGEKPIWALQLHNELREEQITLEKEIAKARAEQRVFIEQREAERIRADEAQRKIDELREEVAALSNRLAVLEGGK